MSNATEPQWETADEAKTRQIHELLPSLLALRAELQDAGLEPSAIVLPKELRPEPKITLPGQAPAVTRDQALALPVIWGDRSGLVVEP